MHFSKTIGLAFATIASSAFAADLPSRRVAPAYVAPAPVFTWTGFYAGLNAGYTWSDNNRVRYMGAPANPPFFKDFGVDSNAVVTAKQSGFIGGGQIGWNYQFSPSFLAGIEVDLQGLSTSGSHINSSAVFADPSNGNPMIMTYGGSKKLSYLGTVRARLGWLPTPSLLLYGTGGLAYGDPKLSSTWNLVRPSFIPLASPDVASTWASGLRVGWTIGGGAEWMFASNWSAKLEYLYYDLGHLSTPTTVLVDTGSVTRGEILASNTSSARFNGHIVRAGLNYHFNFGGAGPVVAKY